MSGLLLPQNRLPDTRVIDLVSKVQADEAVSQEEDELGCWIFYQSHRRAIRKWGRQPEDAKDDAQEVVVRIFEAIRLKRFNLPI